MTDIAKHLEKHPHARAKTMLDLDRIRTKTAELRAENARRFREENARTVPSLTPLQRVWKYAGKLVGWR